MTFTVPEGAPPNTEFAVIAHGRFWHKADMTTAFGDVRFRGNVVLEPARVPSEVEAGESRLFKSLFLLNRHVLVA